MARKRPTVPRITEFDFDPGRTVAGKYEIESKLGGGWEGEVYLVREIETAPVVIRRRDTSGK